VARKCFICSCCGKSKPSTQRILLGKDALCYACAEEYTTLCDCCGECTAETHDKSITAQFVHNAVDKFITNPTESNAFSGIFTF
jgi:hypothetical protein